MNTMNKVLAWNSIWIFGFVYVLGALAEVLPKPLRQSFVDLLFLRKHLSIIALFIMILHAIFSFILLGENYFDKYYVKLGEKMKWNYELSMATGAIAFVLFIVVSLSSVTAIGQEFSWKEWLFA